jgi:6-phosphogluconolactonase (cycloisomerase 2 family)
MPFFGSLGTFGLSRLVVVFVPPVVNPLTNSGSNDVFIVKYNSDGIPLWARRMGATTSDIANSVITDSSGNVIVCGSYDSNPLNIFAANGSTVSFTLANSGFQEGFVVKYDSSGTPVWARRMGGDSSDYARSLTIDSSGNVIVCGSYDSSPLRIFAADGTTSAFTLTKIGFEDAFVVKYDSSGTPVWARKIAGTGTDYARSVSTDSSGNIIVAGQYSSSLNIYAANGTTVVFTLTIITGYDAFVVKYDSSGTPVWARKIGGSASSDIILSVTTDSSGNVIVCGLYDSNPLNIYAANGSTVVFTLTMISAFDSFVVKYDSSGTPLWARKIGGSGNTDQANSVSTDSSGNVIVCGQYNSTSLIIYAADGTTSAFTLTNSGGYDAFVVKYDSSGTPLWARRLGGTPGVTGFEYANSVSTDSSGNVIVVGEYESDPLRIFAADGTTSAFTLARNSNIDAFVVKYNSSGTPLWAKRIAGTGSDIPYGVSTDSSGNIVVTGKYTSTSLSFS